ncbi:tumor necrosis factor receptor superfamily member 16 [Biomphalaria glabrata]|nr:tumor necrosis factor receptor superfamily member 16-like [Biomphalaria glabrata]
METLCFKSIVLFLLLTALDGAVLRQSIVCGGGDCLLGEFYDADVQICRPCLNRTFMDKNYQSCNACKPCTDIRSPGVLVQFPCNQSRDTVFVCAEGYFKTKSDLDIYSCAPCTVCKQGHHILSGCTPLRDTVCGSDADSGEDSGSGNISGWLIPLLSVSIPALILIIAFAIVSLNKVSSIQRKFLCHRSKEDDEVSIVETYKHLQEERKEKRKKKKSKEKEKAKGREATPTES